jgi:uncharacterized protein (DUF2384 family)
MSIAVQASMDVPVREKCRWIKDLFDLKDVEMAHILNISVETLRNWLHDGRDTHAVDSVRFHRLLSLAQLAKGVIRAEKMGHWLHAENKALGDLVPAHLLANPAGYRLVAGVVEDLRSGISD